MPFPVSSEVVYIFVDKLSSTQGSSLEKAGDSKPHGKARVSPLQNKSSLQKMIKSLA